MTFSSSCARLVGKPDASGWVQVYDYKPEDLNEAEEKGHIFVVVSAKAARGGLDEVLIGRKILNCLHEEYFKKNEDFGGRILFKLKRSLEAISREFGNLEGIQIASCVSVGKLVYLASFGGAKIYLSRNGLIAKLLGEKNLSTVSGYLQDGDIILLGTSSFFGKFTTGILKQALTLKNPNECIESLAPLLRSQDNNGAAGLLVVKFFSKEKEDESFIGSANTLSKFRLEEREKRREYSYSYTNSITRQAFRKNSLSRRLKEGLSKILERRVYVSRREEGDVPKKRVSATVGFFFLLLLGISIFFGIRQKAKIDVRKSYETSLLDAKHKFEESLSLYSLNPIRSRELFAEARGIVLGISETKFKDPELEDLKKEISNKEGEILGEYKLTAYDFVDLALLSEGFTGDAMISFQNSLFVLDKNGKRVVRVDVGSKRSEVVAGPSKIDEVLSIAAYSGKIYVLNSEGIFDVTGDKNKVLEKDWLGEVLIYSYAGNFYLLERTSSSIFRYQGDGQKFGKRAGWLSSDLVLDLTDAKTWAIDGSIWVLKESGDIFKFSLGVRQPFELKDSFLKDLKPDLLFTSEDVEFLYLLDKKGGRVVVVSKEGEYKAQYISSIFSGAESFIVSEKEKKIITLLGGKLLAIDLKHLN